MSLIWPDLKFPPINLLVLPKHEVLLEHISKYYYDNYGQLWDDVVFKQLVEEGQLVLTVNGVYNA